MLNTKGYVNQRSRGVEVWGLSDARKELDSWQILQEINGGYSIVQPFDMLKWNLAEGRRGKCCTRQ
jgi:hypothetical protein